MKHLDEWLGDKPWDVIHFNFGLHDLKYVDDQEKRVAVEKGHQWVPVEIYEKNLETIVRRLKKTGAVLVWATSTPVPAGAPAGLVPGEEDRYNATALEVMRRNGVKVDDLGVLARRWQDQIQLPANVHFTPKGYDMLAEQAAGMIRAALGKTGEGEGKPVR